MSRRIVVDRADISSIEVVDDDAGTAGLESGEVRLAVDVFGLSSNNISYAAFGDALGYWAYFPVDADSGCVPVWGFADVVESSHPDVEVGERVFGYLPMATHLVVRPDAASDRSFSDARSHRAGLHPWYNRYHRCSADPVHSSDHESSQVVLWALFMTGWALAEELVVAVPTVVVSSASSKTSMALAWSVRNGTAEARVVGVTSGPNREFVEASGVYDSVVVYDDLCFDDVAGPCAFVDTAGSPGIKQRIHEALGDRLVDSVLLGATHQGVGAATGELPGPAPRFFFIPDVAERRSVSEVDPPFHERFAAAWHEFAPWIGDRLRVERPTGVDGIVEAYGRALAGDVAADEALVLSW